MLGENAKEITAVKIMSMLSCVSIRFRNGAREEEGVGVFRQISSRALGTLVRALATLATLARALRVSEALSGTLTNTQPDN